MLAKLLLICVTLTLEGVYSMERDKVYIEQGELEGAILTSRNGHTFAAFQGIPYAEPPVGNLRFKVRFKFCFTFSHIRKYCDGRGGGEERSKTLMDLEVLRRPQPPLNMKRWFLDCSLDSA
jgi:hypothetical protein